MPILSLEEWNRYLQKHPNAHLLQTGEWGELKSAFGWKPIRVVNGDVGVQILFRKLPLGFTIGYIPKAVVGGQWGLDSGQFSVFSEIDSVCKQNGAIFLKWEPDAWESDQPTSSRITNYEYHLIIFNLLEQSLSILRKMKQKFWRA